MSRLQPSLRQVFENRDSTVRADITIHLDGQDIVGLSIKKLNKQPVINAFLGRLKII